MMQEEYFFMRLWSEVTCHRFAGWDDWSLKVSRVQRTVDQVGHAQRVGRRQVACAKRGRVRALQSLRQCPVSVCRGHFLSVHQA